jgi:hypothetical protein
MVKDGSEVCQGRRRKNSPLGGRRESLDGRSKALLFCGGFESSHQPSAISCQPDNVTQRAGADWLAFYLKADG